MNIPESSIPNAKHTLEALRIDFQKLSAKESRLRASRNAAVHAAHRQRVSVSQLAKETGLSRELIHRILRSPAPSQLSETSSVKKAITQLRESQHALATTVSVRKGSERVRADAIREAVFSQGLLRKTVANFAGVSVETVRKSCLTTSNSSGEIEHPFIP